MCQCENKPNFKGRIKEAFNTTQTSGKQYVVFGSINPNQKDVLWIVTEEFANSEENVCCYFKPISEIDYIEVVKNQTKSKQKTKNKKP